MDDLPAPELDRIDRRLLEAVQRDARLTTAELAAQVALSTSPCWRRLKRLEDAGVILGYHARLDAARLGWGVMAFVHILLESHRAELGAQFEDAVLRIPEVVACHNVSGQYDFLLQVVARDLRHFGEFARAYSECFGELPSETLARNRDYAKSCEKPHEVNGS